MLAVLGGSSFAPAHAISDIPFSLLSEHLSLIHISLFVSGNHENYDLLRNYPISQWHGGLVQAIRPSVLHLMRGQLYNICGKRIFTMGGASSHDIRDGILEPDNPDYERKLLQLNAAGALLSLIHI